jgi:hypothetical protein
MIRRKAMLILMVLALVGAAGCRKDPPPQEQPPSGEESAPAEAESTDEGEPVAPAAPQPPAEEPAPAEAPPADLASPQTDEAAPTAEPAPAPGDDSQAPQPLTAPAQAEQPVQALPPLQDVRLLLTVNDAEEISRGKGALRRTVLPGVPSDADTDSLYYEPTKGNSYGLGVQVFRSRNAVATRDRFAAMMASYPSAQEIAPVAGRTFFAYWDEVLFVAFIQPPRNLVVVLSCGRNFCDSDSIYELSRKVSARSN